MRLLNVTFAEEAIQGALKSKSLKTKYRDVAGSPARTIDYRSSGAGESESEAL